MKITVKFFSSLMEYLPTGSDDNFVELNVGDGFAVNDVLEKFNVPKSEIQTVMKNGAFLPEEERGNPLQDGDTITLWPSIQGG